MLIFVILALAAQVKCAVENIPYSTPLNITLNSTSPSISYDFNPSTGAGDYINIYYDFRSISHSPPIRYSQTVFSYAEVSFNGSSTAPILWTNIESKLMDQNGYIMMKNQLISLKRTDYVAQFIPTVNMTVKIVAFSMEADVSFEVTATLVVNTSVTRPCPSNCNGRGQCNTSTGVCDFCSPYTGYDCSVMLKEFDLDSQINTQAGKLVYGYLPATYTTKALTLLIQKSDHCGVGYLNWKMDDNSRYLVMSIFEGSGKNLSGVITGSSGSVSAYGGALYFAFLNYGPEDCEVQVQFSENTLSILLIIMIVLGVAILIALIVGIIYIVKKRRDFRMVRPHLRDGLISEAETLSKEDVQRYFPPVLGELVLINKESVNGSTSDLIPTQDCVICLCPIERNEIIRVTYCNHLFHKDCLSGWFSKVQAVQNCPYCREDFSKSHVKELYKKICNFTRELKGNNSLELIGNELAQQIVEYHLAKAHAKQEPTSILSQRQRMNIEYME